MRVRPKETRNDANGDGTVVQRKQTPDYIDLEAARRGDRRCSATVGRAAVEVQQVAAGIAAGRRRGKTARWKVGKRVATALQRGGPLTIKRADMHMRRLPVRGLAPIGGHGAVYCRDNIPI